MMLTAKLLVVKLGVPRPETRVLLGFSLIIQTNLCFHNDTIGVNQLTTKESRLATSTVSS